VPLTWILSPLKYFDWILQHHGAAGNIASGYYILAKKPLNEKTDKPTNEKAIEHKT
jgi:hypothetical protein